MGVANATAGASWLRRALWNWDARRLGAGEDAQQVRGEALGTDEVQHVVAVGQQLEEETIDELEDASDEPRHALSPLPSSRGNGNGNSATSSNGAATPSPPRAARAFSVGL